MAVNTILALVVTRYTVAVDNETEVSTFSVMLIVN